jgi:MFS family permease
MGFNVLAVMNAGSFVGRILPAYVADHVGRYNTFVPCCALSGVFALTLWLPAHSLAPTIVFAILYGIVSGAFIALNTPCLAVISKMEKIGTRIGIYYAMISFL